MTHGCVKFAKSTNLLKQRSHAIVSGPKHARDKRAHRTTKRRELPIQNPDQAVLRRVKDEVIKFIVAMYDPHTACLALVRQVPLIPGYELVPPWYFAHRLAHVDVLHRGLRERDFGQGLDLAWEIRLVRAEIFEPDAFWVERGECAECAHCGEPAVVC